jgi:MFS family permease
VLRLTLSACALRFLDSFMLISPFYAVMFAEKGLAPAQIGTVLTAWSVMGLVLEVPCGVLADRTSRRWLLASAQLVRCVGFLVWIAFPGFWGFLIGLMLWGLKSATMSGCFEAVVYDDLKAVGREGEYVRIMGRAQAARALGLVAAALGAAVVARYGYDVLNLASVAAGAVAAGSALTLPNAPRTAAVGRWGYLRHLRRGAVEAARLPGVPRLILFIAASQAVVYAIADYWQLFARDVGLSKPGIALFLAALAAVGATAALLAQRWRGLPVRALYLMIVACGIGVTAAALIFRPWCVALIMLYVGLYWTVDVNADARFQHALRPETRATVASVKGFAMQCGTSVLMFGFGVVAQLSAYRWAFLCAGLIAIAVGGGYALVGGRIRQAAPAG